MKSTKQRALSFIAVLPIVASCASELIKTTNPPPLEPTTKTSPTPEPATKTVNPPEPLPEPQVNPPPPEPELKFPPPSYSKREKKNGKCYVQVYVNPPYQAEVSCTAPIEPAPEGEKWCKVASAKDSKVRVSVECDAGSTTSTPLPKPADNPKVNPPPPQRAYSKREKRDGKCYVDIITTYKGTSEPPYPVEVSCTASIEPASGGVDKWCKVATVNGISDKMSVDCSSK